MRRSKTATIIDAMRILAEDIHSEDGIANAAIREAADRLAELEAAANRQCTWTRDEDYDDTYDGACGLKWGFIDGGPREGRTKYCRRCGGRVKVARKRR